MILRKPYAFLIKHFKLLHLIVSGLLIYLIYRLNMLLRIVSSYLKDITVINNVDLINEYFNIYMFIIPFVIIVFAVTIYFVMYLKKKPRLFYAITVISSVAVLAIFSFVYGKFEIMQYNIINVRVVSLMRDFITIALVLMSFLLIIYIVRATGFDIKKFNFGQDLQELEIKEEDNEEFEVNIEFDPNEINRGLRRRIRFAKYVYVENKFLINIAMFVVLIVISFFLYFRLTTRNIVYKQNQTFASTNFIMHVDNVYLTDKDYKGNKVTDNKLLVVDLMVKNKSSRNFTFDTYSLSLDLGGDIYLPTIKYKDKLLDLGINYINQNITKNGANYIFVFEIPSTKRVSNAILKYVDSIGYSRNTLRPKYVRVGLNPKNLEGKTDIKALELGESIEFDALGLKGGKLNLATFELKEKFKVSYKFCVTNSECYTSYEYIKPNIINNYEKAVLKVTGEVVNSNKMDSRSLIDLYSYIEKFGTLKYVIGGKEKIQKVSFKQIQPTKFKANNTYYVEVLKEVLNADEIFLEFNIRGKIYSYKLK